ncbi:SARP family transcriptional regulator [Rhizocola hellebori]|uniref:SARP family transcriptional regulator n=1 Tax=Rhizocola hellebori TaxID=1392758 RepID=A0A8J3VHA4_9ACTN|nr:SARP family transcriptional regulator [Rhizocola hellebori]
MRYGVLGPIEVRTADGRLLEINQPRRRALLGALALHANRPISVTELVGALWEHEAPDRARATLRTHIWGLRRLLEGSAGISTSRNAYRLEIVGDDELDLLSFHRLARDARRALAHGQLHQAAELFGRAVALWRGEACEDAPLMGRFAGEAAALTEERLALQEDFNELRLTLGHYDGMVTELNESVRLHPLRERMWGQLMLALHRQGRQAEALATYERLRLLLADQLGVGPGPEVWRRHGEILTADRRPPASVVPQASDPPQASGGRSGPAQLPRGVGQFAGRRTELARLEELCGRGGLALVDGIPGAGKTALAVRFAHHVADRFPDGQLYIDLRGFGPEPPTSAGDALAEFLRALGVSPDDVPAGPDQRAALFRTLTAGRRLLVVLDNARSAQQVRPLLTSASDSLVLVTSRNRLRGLVARDGAARVTVDVVGEAAAVDILAAVIGRARVDEDCAALRELVRLCGGLPLALRVAAERVASQPSIGVSEFVNALAAEHGRLDALAIDGDETATVRSVFSWSLRALAESAARLFALLGLHPGAEFSTFAAAALAGTQVTAVRPLLDALAGGHLVEPTGPDRYRLHDLVRLYAIESVRELPAPDQAAARRRVLGWYLHSADAADRMLIRRRPRISLEPPEEPNWTAAFADIDGALAWCETERANLVAAVTSAVAAGEHTIAWQLPVALWGFFMLRKYRDDWAFTTETGLAAARRAGDRSGEAWALTCLGVAYADGSRFAESQPRLLSALAIRRAIGDRVGEGTALVALACMHLDRGDVDDAEANYLEALDIYRETGDRWSEGIALTGLGVICMRRKDADGAVERLEQSAALSRAIGDPWGEAMARHALGAAYRDAGRHDDAIACLTATVETQRTIGDEWGQGATMFELGRCLQGVGRQAEAAQAWQDALPILTKVDAAYADIVRSHLAELTGPA